MTPSAMIPAVRAAHDALLTTLAWSAFAALATLLAPRARQRAIGWIEAVDAVDRSRLRRAVLGIGIMVALWFSLLKACQLLGYQLTTDAALMPNTAASFWSGRGMESVLDGTPSTLAVHFAFFIPVFLGPLLILWKSALPFALIQGAAVASVGTAAFFLAQRRTGSSFWGLVAMAMVWSHPSFHELVTADLENSVFVIPLLVWGLVSLDAGFYRVTAALWALALTTREQFPFSLAGLGLYHALTSARPARRRWLEGLGVVLGAAFLWALEMRLVGSYPDSLNTASYWTLYSHFGSSRGEIILTVLTRPDKVLATIFWPPEHLAPLGRVLAGMAFIPLAAPPAMVFLLVSIVHNLLQSEMCFQMQNEAYVFGPLVFATACGLRVLLARKTFAGARRLWLLAAVLAASGFGLTVSSRVIHPTFNMSAAREVPRLAARIPAGASLWTDDFLAAPLSVRSQIKTFMLGVMRPRFESLLFRPEYVLVDKLTLIAMGPPAHRDQVIGFLAREGYRKIEETRAFVLLQDPQAPHKGRSPELHLAAYAEEAARGAPFVAAVLDSEEARRTLASYPPDLRYAPETAEQHAAFARVLAARGLLAPAIVHGKAAVRLRPGFPVAHNNLGNALAAAGDLAGAEKHLREALRLKPDDGLAAYNLGNVLLRSGKALEAAAILETAVRLEGGDARIFNSLGAAQLLSGRRAAARASFERALQIDPALSGARENLKRL
ncbi:MAG: DUF2079 domain-containing protein [Elusimicrobiota bacterium]